MINRATRAVCFGFKAKPGNIQIIDEYIDDAHGAVFADVIVQSFREKCRLRMALAFNEGPIISHPSTEKKYSII